MKAIQAPFSPAQVQRLNEVQTGVLSAMTLFHPFTCGHRGDEFHAPVNSATDVLIATEAGWICPYCGAAQDWALEVMVEPKPDEAKFHAYLASIVARNGQSPDAHLLDRIEGAIEAYRSLSQSRKLSRNQTTEENATTQRIWDTTEIMLQCLYRRRLALKGVEVRPGRELCIDSNWISRTEKLPPAGHHVEVLCCDPRICNRAHPGYGHGYTVHVSLIEEEGLDDTFSCELIGKGPVTHWRELPDSGQSLLPGHCS